MMGNSKQLLGKDPKTPPSLKRQFLGVALYPISCLIAVLRDQPKGSQCSLVLYVQREDEVLIGSLLFMFKEERLDWFITALDLRILNLLLSC